MRRLAMAAGMIVALTATAQAAGPVSVSSDEVIAGRQAGFDLMQAVAGSMKAAVEAGQPVKPLTDGAKAIAAWARVVPSAFPVGTEAGHDTKAKPEIWSDAAGFAKAAANLQDTAGKLAALAEADDKTGFAAQFDVMGKACGACHRAYRVRQN